MQNAPGFIGQRRLVFRVGEQIHEINADKVIEIARVPPVTRVPHAPASLTGVANMRGKPIPVLSMRQILDMPGQTSLTDGKIVLFAHQGTVGLLVDDVLHLASGVSAPVLEGLEQRLDGAFKFAGRTLQEKTLAAPGVTAARAVEEIATLLSFRVAGQLFGLPIEHVSEVIKGRTDFTVLPEAATSILGLMPIRDHLVPLVSLSSLLGLAPVAQLSNYIIVVQDGDGLIALVVDELDLVHRLPKQNIDAVPEVLQRGGEAQIAAIARSSNSEFLISILTPDRLFSHRAVKAAVDQTRGDPGMAAGDEELTKAASEKFLIFRLGDESYGVPVSAVNEVIRVPSEITRVPGTPDFVIGIINLRGKPVPLVDQRMRFAASNSDSRKGARAVILNLQGLQTGFVVDEVSEVRPFRAGDVSEAPEFSTERTEVFDRIANMEDGRMILLVAPQELLSRTERDVLAAITRERSAMETP